MRIQSFGRSGLCGENMYLDLHEDSSSLSIRLYIWNVTVNDLIWTVEEPEVHFGAEREKKSYHK